MLRLTFCPDSMVVFSKLFPLKPLQNGDTLKKGQMFSGTMAHVGPSFLFSGCPNRRDHPDEHLIKGPRMKQYLDTSANLHGPRSQGRNAVTARFTLREDAENAEAVRAFVLGYVRHELQTVTMSGSGRRGFP